MITPEQIAKAGTEHAEQAALFCWASQYPQLKWMHAIPNGGKRDIVAAGKLKAEGVKAGVADIFLPAVMVRKHVKDGPRMQDEWWQTYGGLYIEMKRANGKLSDQSAEQKAFQVEVEVQGYAYHLSFGWMSAAMAVCAYTGIQWI